MQILALEILPGPAEIAQFAGEDFDGSGRVDRIFPGQSDIPVRVAFQEGERLDDHRDRGMQFRSGGVQNFPSSYNYLNEGDRFRYAGRLWREADWERLMKLFDSMIAVGVAWDPTLEIYEASRDLQRAQTQPWFRDYLHPVLEDYFRPNLENHGSYFLNWSTTDEAFWKENYQLWMRAVREFARRGGVVTIGEDAGYIYQMYGFGMIRNLELHQEAGFHPLQIVQQATVNGARVLRQEGKLGRVRAGWAADILIVDGNPLEDFKLLYPAAANAGVKPGLLWTIKGGIPYSVPQLMEEVKVMVEKARKGR